MRQCNLIISNLIRDIAAEYRRSSNERGSVLGPGTAVFDKFAVHQLRYHYADPWHFLKKYWLVCMITGGMLPPELWSERWSVYTCAGLHRSGSARAVAHIPV